MKIRTLLLGSAAVLALAGVAQAAAPATATKPAAAAKPAAPVKPAATVKPVAYVTVCDAFGLGFFYIPGQMNTCFRLQGQIRYDINFHSRDTVGPWATTTSPHEAAWDSQAQGQLTFTARRMTDHGDLIGVVRVVATSNNGSTIQVATSNAAGANGDCYGQITKGVNNFCRVPVDRYMTMDRAYIQYGGLEVGYNSSAYGSGTTKHVNLAWELGGHDFVLGFEDPRDRWGSRLPRYYWVPDVIASLSGDLPAKGRGTWGLSAGVAEVQVPNTPATVFTAGGNPGLLVWGASARTTINTPLIGKGDQLTFSGTIGTGCAFVSDGCGQGTNSTGALMYQGIAQFLHVFTPTLRAQVRLRYTDPNPSQVRTDLQTQVTWTPINVGGFSVQNQLTANTTLFGTAPVPPTTLEGQIRFQLQY
jgi:hypothetical protein